jgi:hypothetical protein
VQFEFSVCFRPFQIWTQIQRALRAMGATALESANCAGTENERNTLIKMPGDPIIIVVSALWIFWSSVC